MKDNKKRVIFVIDDEPEIRNLLAEYLSDNGYSTTAFSKPQDLLERLRADQPLAIITDFKMPEMNGLELAKSIRAIDTKVKIAILTGYADKSIAIGGLSAGINDLLEKPCQMPVVLNLVNKYRDHKLAEEENELKEMREIKAIFLEEARDLYGDLDNDILRLEERPLEKAVVDSLFRRVHSVKGGSGSISGAQDLASLSHEFENVLALIRKDALEPTADHIDLFLAAADLSRKLFDGIETEQPIPTEIVTALEDIKSRLKGAQTGEALSPTPAAASPKESSASTVGQASAGEKRQATASAHSATEKDEGILVANERLDDFMRISGELIVIKNTFDQVVSHDESFHDLGQLRRRLGDLMVNLNKMTDELQTQIVTVRRIPLEKAFSKLPRLVRQTAQSTSKKVALETVGLELGVDKNLSKSLSQCLTHMVRNSIDHGVETPEERILQGKPETGTIKITATEGQGLIRVVISDDGKGINRDKVLQKAIAAKLVDPASVDRLTDGEIFSYIFEPGFSTADKVTDVSGRGVGMDAVKTAIESHGGRILIESKLGVGSTFHLEIPVPRAVMIEKTVLASDGDKHFAIPLDGINRIVSCDELEFFEVDGLRRCMLDDKTVVTGSYNEFFSQKFDHSISLKDLKGRSCIFLKAKNKSIGLVVDKIEGQLEAVVKPFDPITGELPGLKGTSMFGSDRVAYVVAAENFLQMSMEHR